MGGCPWAEQAFRRGIEDPEQTCTQEVRVTGRQNKNKAEFLQGTRNAKVHRTGKGGGGRRLRSREK